MEIELSEWRAGIYKSSFSFSQCCSHRVEKKDYDYTTNTIKFRLH